MSTKPCLNTYLNKPYDQPGSSFTLFAAPLDLTTSNRSGTRFGPDAIRLESTYLDTYSPRTGLDWDDLDLCDIGNVACNTMEECLSGVEKTIKEIKNFPVMLGGEHTITLGAVRAKLPDLIVVFDAHLDMRDQLFGMRLCHATYLRRALEEIQCNTLIIGARALSGEEIMYADKRDEISYVTSQTCLRDPASAFQAISEAVESTESIYLSIDMDVLDPAYAPAVGNPHPEGITVTSLIDMVDKVMKGNVVGLDLTEVYPHYDQGNTASTAAYVVLESLYCYTRYHLV